MSAAAAGREKRGEEQPGDHPAGHQAHAAVRLSAFHSAPRGSKAMWEACAMLGYKPVIVLCRCNLPCDIVVLW